MQFLKGGKYLIGEQIDELGTTFKGKNLETDEIVSIKKISKNFEHINTIIDTIKKITERIPNSIKFKEYFESENNYYFIQNCYDDNLEHFMRINKKLTPNLIHKIFTQLNTTFKSLLDNDTFITVRPSNILIKYCNPEKTNFDSFFSDYFIFTEKNEKDTIKNSSLLKLEYRIKNEISNFYQIRCNLDIPNKKKVINSSIYDSYISQKDNTYFSPYLYSIGLTIYFLFFGCLPYSKFSLVNFNMLLDKQKDIKVKIKEDSNLEDLLNKILKKNTKERICWKEYFTHPFFNQYKY